MQQWQLSNGMVMALDGVEHRFHVRERDNRVAIVLTQPGWAALGGNDYWYLSVEDLVDTGTVSEGQKVKRWVHRENSTWIKGMTRQEAMDLAGQWYVREATA